MSSKMGRITQTITDCSSSLKIDRTYYKAIVLRANCYKKLKKYKECMKDYKAALKIKYTIDIEIELKKVEKIFKETKQVHKRRRKTKKNHYEVLGIKQTATDGEIRRAYKKLALVHHPDRHSDATEGIKREQTEIFKRIGNAYEVLIDPRKRFEYDLYL